jgi:hypothetical protein
MNMDDSQRCPDCGAIWAEGQTCQDHFHQMLFWEAEDPRNGEVHHLTVLCYHLQHPRLYSPEGLRYATQLLGDFLEGASLQEVRQRNRDLVDSGKRTWKIKGAPEARGSYAHPLHWTMTAADVVAGGMESYCENVRRWAVSVLQAINIGAKHNP